MFKFVTSSTHGILFPFTLWLPASPCRILLLHCGFVHFLHSRTIYFFLSISLRDLISPAQNLRYLQLTILFLVSLLLPLPSSWTYLFQPSLGECCQCEGLESVHVCMCDVLIPQVRISRRWLQGKCCAYLHISFASFISCIPLCVLSSSLVWMGFKQNCSVLQEATQS